MSGYIVKNQVYVTVHYVSTMHKEGFLLEKDLDYADIADAVFQSEEVSKYSPDALKISISNNSGWELELYDGVEYDASKITVNKIVADDVLTVRVKNDRVGGRELISVLQSAYEKVPVLKSRYKYLSNTYCGFRTIKNDGNGYFRAIYFGLFEHIILTNQRHVFALLQARFYSILNKHNESDRSDPNFTTTSTYLNFVIDALEGAADDRRWLTTEELEADVLDSEYEFDFIFISMLRKLVVEFIIENRKMKLAGSGSVSLESVIMDHYSEYDDLETYCSERLLVNGASMEGPVADYGCLFYAMNCQGIVCLVDRKKEIKLSITTVGSSNINNSDDGVVYAKIHLILRGSHYDILYPNDDALYFKKGGLTNSIPTPPRSPKEVQNARLFKKEPPRLSTHSSNRSMKSESDYATPQGNLSGGSSAANSNNNSSHSMVEVNPNVHAAKQSSQTSPVSLQLPRTDSLRSSSDTSSSKQERHSGVNTPVLAVPAAAVPKSSSPAPAKKQLSASKDKKVFTMEQMEEELAALDIRIEDKNIVYDLCSSCSTIPQAVALYYKKYGHLVNLTLDMRQEDSDGDDDDEGVMLKAVPSVVPRGVGTTRAHSFNSVVGKADQRENGNSDGNFFSPVVPQLELPVQPTSAPSSSRISHSNLNSASESTQQINQPIAHTLVRPPPPTAVNNTGPNSCANTEYLDRQFLPLLSMGFDIDQILEAVDVGECNNFEVALGYLKRKMKWIQSRSSRNILAGVASEADNVAVRRSSSSPVTNAREEAPITRGDSAPPPERGTLKTMSSMFFSKVRKAKSDDNSDRKEDDAGNPVLSRNNSGGMSKLRAMQTQANEAQNQEFSKHTTVINTIAPKPKPVQPPLERKKSLTAVQQQIVAKLTSTGVTQSEAVELAEQFNTIDEFCDFIENMEKKKKVPRQHISRQKSMAPPVMRTNTMVPTHVQPPPRSIAPQVQNQAPIAGGSKWGKLKMATKLNAAIANGAANGDTSHNPRTMHTAEPKFQHQVHLQGVQNAPRIHHSQQHPPPPPQQYAAGHMPQGAPSQQVLQTTHAFAAPTSAPLVPFAANTGAGTVSKAAEEKKKKSTWGVLKSFVAGGKKS